MTKPPICPVCNEKSKLVDERFNKKYACCGLWSWGGKPLTDRETHNARIAAHNSFDPLWKTGFMRRGKAYALLAKLLNVKEREAHMSIMPKELALQVPAAVKQIWVKCEEGEGL